MKLKIFASFLFCFTLMLSTEKAAANHLLGGELFYEYISGPSTSETYKVTLILYADCGSALITQAYAALPTATPEIQIYNGSGFQGTLTLLEVPSQSDIEITPVCPEQADSTTCTSLSYVLPGVKKFTYTATVTLSGTAPDWRFDFEGQLVNSTAGRSNIIGNIVNNGGQILFLEATLNNTLAPNSSTVYTSEPTPFFCINTQQEYNLGAIDPNNDSLGYALIPAKIDAVTNVNYISPYSGTNPLPTAPGSFIFNPVNGQLSFIPNLAMNCVVVNRVDEYRNGVKVGSNMREMTFVILPNCNNSAPAPGAITGLTNGVITGNNEITVCQGMTDTLQFGFTTSDQNGDSIKLTYAGLPVGAVAIITNNNSLNPSFHFSWNTVAVAPGTYTFYVTFKDDGCPLASKQTIAYTIKIVPFQGALNTGAIVGCKNAHNGVAWIFPQPQDQSLYTFTWHNAGGQVLQTSPSSNQGDTLAGLDPGTYTVEVVNPNGCNTSFSIVVPAPNYQAGFTLPQDACINTQVAITNTSTASFNAWSWSFGDGQVSQSANPAHTYDSTGSFTVTLIGNTTTGCFDTVSHTVTIHKTDITVSQSHTAICEGAQAVLEASGTVSYLWTPATGLTCPTCGTTGASPVINTSYTVVGTDAFGCTDTGMVLITVHPANLNASPDTSVCPLDAVMLRASGALSYSWSPSTWLSDSTVSNPVSMPLGNITYTVIGSFPFNCMDTQTVEITTFSSAVINLADRATIYPGESYQIDPGGNCLYFSWFPPLGLTNAAIANPIAAPEVNTRYFLTGITENGCRSVDSIDIYVDPETLLEVPNAFSPGSEPNSELKVIKRGTATLSYFRIFNRWGKMVFETTDIEKGWNGRYNNTPQPMGVFVYMVEAHTSSGRKFYKQGNVTLIR